MALLLIAQAANAGSRSEATQAEKERLSSLFKKGYSHYEAVRLRFDVGGSRSVDEPRCPAQKDVDSALRVYPNGEKVRRRRRRAIKKRALPKRRALEFAPWSLQVDLKPHDSRVFAPLRITVRRLAGKTDAYRVYRDGILHACHTDKASAAMIQWQRYWITLRMACSAGVGLFRYEVWDLLRVLARATKSKVVPSKLVYSPCGSVHIEFVDASRIKKDAQKRRSYWGRSYPAVREKARRRLSSGKK